MAMLRAPRRAMATEFGTVPYRPSSKTRLPFTSPQTRNSFSLCTDDPKETAGPSLAVKRASDMSASYDYLV
mgnify:CR=1 FL=1